MTLTREAWLMEVNRIMERDWYITLLDAGRDDADIDLYYSWGDTPAAFVTWFADKYDLIQFDGPECLP